MPDGMPYGPMDQDSAAIVWNTSQLQICQSQLRVTGAANIDGPYRSKGTFDASTKVMVMFVSVLHSAYLFWFP